MNITGLLVSVYGDRLGDEPCVVAVCPRTGEAERIPVAPPPGAERCMGLCSDGDLVYVLTASDTTSHLLCFDAATMTHQACHHLAGVRDGHSVLKHGRRLYAVSSGTDEVVQFTLTARGPTKRRVIWAPASGQRDTHHLNSLARAGGGLLVTAFGVAPQRARTSGPSGYVYDITARHCVVERISHPHSVGVHGGEIYFCESRAGRFRTRDRVVVTLDGYLRGAAWLPGGLVCLGTSAGRPPHGAPHGDREECALWIVDPTGGAVVRRIPFGRFGPEIYDVIFAEKARRR